MTVARRSCVTAALLAAVALAGAEQARANQCLRAETPPPPPARGAVLAAPIDPASEAPNVLVLELDQDPSAIFHGDYGATCLAIARNPRTITVAPGGSLVFFFGEDAPLSWYVNWGAVNVGPSDPPPVLLPDGADPLFGQVEQVWVLDPVRMLEDSTTCRRCDLSGREIVLTAIPEGGEGHLSLAFLGEVSGADLRNATVTHVELGPPGTGFDYDFNGADFRGATFDGTLLAGAHFADANIAGATFDAVNLRGASFNRANVRIAGNGNVLPGARFINGTDLTGADFTLAALDHSSFDDVQVDGADFTGAQLYGTQFTALRFGHPPRFDQAVLGGDPFAPAGSPCTAFVDLPLLDVSFAAATWNGSGCAGALFPGSQVRLGLLASLLTQPNIRGGLDVSHTQVLVTAADRKALAGADLSAARLAGTDFIGEALDLTGTRFDAAVLAGVNVSLARLAGATFENAAADGASFTGADLTGDGTHPAASFAGPATSLRAANFVNANGSGASFQGADLSDAVFTGMRGEDVTFSGVLARNAVFAGAHLYGNGQAFDQARDMEGVDFTGAVLASDPTQSGGFDFTGAALGNARFDGAVCVACNFTGAQLLGASFTGAYLPGVVFANADLARVDLDRAWLYCGDLGNGACASLGTTPPSWEWPLRLGSGEAYGPVPFGALELSGVSFADVTACPDGKAGAVPPAGCDGHLLPDPASAPPIPAPCSASADGACSTPARTLFDATALGEPLAIVPAVPPTWNTMLATEGYVVAFDDGTVRRVAEGPSAIVAGTPGMHCPAAHDACGDGGPATSALLGTPSGLAVGLDGSLYIADSTLLRVRRIDPSGTISTVAGGGGAGCDIPCGDGGPATAARLGAANGVSVDPLGVLLIADGNAGVRRVERDGTISTVAPGAQTGNVVAVTATADGVIYASTDSPDLIIRIDPDSGAVTPVVGTGTSGYNGNTDEFGLLAPGTEVQVNGPRGLAVDLDGSVVFADRGNNLIRAYVPSSDHVIDNLAGVVNDDGTTMGGFNGDGHPATATQLQAPRAVTATRGTLRVIADSGNRRIRLIGPGPASGFEEPEPPPPPTPVPTPTARAQCDDCGCTIAPQPRASAGLLGSAAVALLCSITRRRRRAAN